MSSMYKFKTKYERMIAYNSILEQIRKGKTYRQIAKEFGISTPLITSIKRKYPKGFTEEEIEKERMLYEELAKKPMVNQIPLELNTQETTADSQQTQQPRETTNEEVNNEPPVITDSLVIPPYQTKIPPSIFILATVILVCIGSISVIPNYINYNSRFENVMFVLNCLIITLSTFSIHFINNTNAVNRLIQLIPKSCPTSGFGLDTHLKLMNNDSKDALIASMGISTIILLSLVYWIIFYFTTQEKLTTLIPPSIQFITSIVVLIVNYHNRQKVKQQLDLIKYIESKISKPL